MNGKLYCIHLISEDKKEYFGIDAVACLPMEMKAQGYELKSSHQLCYLSDIMKVYKLIPPVKKSKELKGKNS